MKTRADICAGRARMPRSGKHAIGYPNDAPRASEAGKYPHQGCRHDGIAYKLAYSHVQDTGPERQTTPTRHGAKRSEEHTSELQSLMRISYAVSSLNNKNINIQQSTSTINIIYYILHLF